MIPIINTVIDYGTGTICFRRNIVPRDSLIVDCLKIC